MLTLPNELPMETKLLLVSREALSDGLLRMYTHVPGEENQLLLSYVASNSANSVVSAVNFRLSEKKALTKGKLSVALSTFEEAGLLFRAPESCALRSMKSWNVIDKGPCFPVLSKILHFFSTIPYRRGGQGTMPPSTMLSCQ